MDNINNTSDTNKIKQFVCLTGLPRTGSTLLSAILSQNPEIHAEGNSAVCELVYRMDITCNGTAREQLSACNRHPTTCHDIISQIPQIYYKDYPGKIVVDKCRSWSIKGNTELLQKYICKDFKMIVLERPICEIVKSFARLYKQNNMDGDLTPLLSPMSEPIMRSINGLTHAKAEAAKDQNNSHYLFITYDEVVNDTQTTISKIYEFCGWEPFKHDFKHVFAKFPENDQVYGIKGHHTIRQKVEKKNNPIILPHHIQQKCTIIDQILGYSPRPEGPTA
jgi:sulfotransferase